MMFYIDFYKETNTISSYLICHLQDSTASKDVPNISEEEKKKIEEELKQRKQEKLERQKEKEKRMYVYISDYPTLCGKNIIPCWREGCILFWCPMRCSFKPKCNVYMYYNKLYTNIYQLSHQWPNM